MMATSTLSSAETATRDLILSLADSKRLLGMRYAEWLLGAPELEAGIACASMAQDEWGHARLLYSLLRDFGEDTDRIEHERGSGEYTNIETLDAAPPDWPSLVVLNAFVDTALSVQFESMRQSSHTPLRQRMEKMLEEERFHGAHGAAWIRRLADAQATRSATIAAVERVLPAALRWFGPERGRAAELVESGVVADGADTLRARYLERVAPLLAALGIGAPQQPDFSGFDDARRRGPGGPDEETLERVRGDKNRTFLMD